MRITKDAGIVLHSSSPVALPPHFSLHVYTLSAIVRSEKRMMDYSPWALSELFLRGLDLNKQSYLSGNFVGFGQYSPEKECS